MSNRLDEIQKLTFTGAVDADGHILEDAGLWDRYIEAKYKDRAVRVRTDDKGLEYLEVAGRPSKVRSRESASSLRLPVSSAWNAV